MTSYLSQKFQYLTSFSSEPEDVKEGELNSENRQELEQSKLIIMKSLIEKQDPSAKNGIFGNELQDVDDLMMRRFLRARDLDVEKATDMLIKYLKWRIEFVPNGCISPSEIRNDLSQNKLFMQGYDKTGSPILVVLAARRKPTPVPEFKRFVTYVLDKVCARMPSGQEKFTFIADLDGWGFANNDMHGSLAALSILQVKLLFLYFFIKQMRILW
ncbi:PREDICTED: random slug protein 5-like [Erythranthe guttata]|uniref:random slug protein 5-like n=1 Tax=Erythranthe guttata TaxID=4155 RepID=UPI00064DD0B8|nr:PREDICTED: random slug protein 5-like [Erythranthe guttata]|eukprot:XP_012848446.1 PREDICTED: random slug protein 5-like [Erythranthe guttata]